jgi:ribosomal protein L10
MKTETTYQVIVGNIGIVYEGDNPSDALQIYKTYKKQSSEGYGRASHEDVYLAEKKLGDGFMNTEIIQEHQGN